MMFDTLLRNTLSRADEKAMNTRRKSDDRRNKFMKLQRNNSFSWTSSVTNIKAIKIMT